MPTTPKLRSFLRTIVHTYGTTAAKRSLWNGEFARGHWEGLEDTAGDCVYPFIEKHLKGGSILDLGCGSGNTANELDEATFREYTGVDISDVAIEKARRRTRENGRTNQYRFAQGDIFSHVPAGRYDVILFRDSIYYVPWADIQKMLNRYAMFLKQDGVFIVRMWSGTDKYKPIAETIGRTFHVVERHESPQPPATVLVFCQKDSYRRSEQ
jgi:SAM-dependent methyltransferase